MLHLAQRRAPASVVRDRATGGVQLNAGGYGYGLRIAQNCSFKTIVSHGGGLPGFGTVMTWLPDYGLGIVAFGNLTYTGWGGIATNALDALVAKSGLHPRQPSPSPALTDARDKVSRLVVNWDDRLADSIAADKGFMRSPRLSESSAARSMASNTSTMRSASRAAPASAMLGVSRAAQSR